MKTASHALPFHSAPSPYLFPISLPYRPAQSAKTASGTNALRTCPARPDYSTISQNEYDARRSKGVFFEMVRQLRPPPNLHLVQLQEDGSGPEFEHATDLLKEWDLEFDFGGKAIGIGSGIGDRIPGYRTSAAFLSTLRQNLHLSSSLLAPDTPTTTTSPMSTPPSLRASTSALSPPSPLSTSTILTPPSSGSSTAPETQTSDLLSDIPPLSTYVTASPDEKVAALKLIADSIAQQRQVASQAVIYHPISVGVAIAILGIMGQYFYTGPSSLALIGTTFLGVLMALLISVRLLAGPYLELAERIGWKWLGESEILVTRFGEDIIGTLVFEVKREGRKRKKGVLRAWTVRMRERGRGVGKGLLEEVVKVLVTEKGCDGAVWEEGNPYSDRVLPAIFNGGFDRRQERARKLLDEIVEAQFAQGKKRRSS